MATNLFPSWTCTKCGKRHYEMTDHRICADKKDCEDRIVRSGVGPLDRYFPSYSKRMH